MATELLRFRAFIQTADFQAVHEAPTYSHIDAFNIFESRDWERDLRDQEQWRQQGRPTCAPGFGVTDGETGHVLHLCPKLDRTIDLRWTRLETERVLGLLTRNRKMVRIAESLDFETVRAAVRDFMTGYEDRLFPLFSGSPGP